MFSFFRRKSQEQKQEMEEKREENFLDATSVAEYFYKETGITFTQQMNILESKLVAFCRKRAIYSFEELLQKVQKEYSLRQELIDTLTTNETYFYREVKQIKELVMLVKEKQGQHQTILCAPCATGEEPYSIAIALLEAGIDANSFYITGIDINEEAIFKAKEAGYKERNVKSLTPEILQKYFTFRDEKYYLKEWIKKLVSFKVVNIFDTSMQALGKFDFVFSRNMLIYFDKETKLRAKKILESMQKNTTQNVFFGHADLF